jgi:carboxypeptidase C (cathepsin A)
LTIKSLQALFDIQVSWMSLKIILVRTLTFVELGPCNITKDLKSEVNPYAWNEVTNLLFISQPLGVGFSYSEQLPGSLNPSTGEREGPDYGIDGRYPVINPTELDTTQLSAVATWQVIQGFLGALPRLSPEVGNTTKKINLWTESYGGHYGPTFFKYFYQQSQLISNGSIPGIPLIFDTLGIGNGLIDTAIQTPYYPEFANFNTYSIKAVNDTVYDYMKFAYFMEGGCLTMLRNCETANRTTEVGQLLCQQAFDQCQVNVEKPYYKYGDRGAYDIRHPYEDPTPRIILRTISIKHSCSKLWGS